MRFNHYLYEINNSLQFHKELEKTIWDKEEDKYILKKPIRDKLLEIADKWMEFAHIPRKHVKNILFTGSLANFNYVKETSDIDLHVLVDYDSISKDFEFLYDYFKDKKLIWGDNHDITIKGFPVEMYAQPMSEKPHTNQGVYSVSSNKWIQEPKPIEIDMEGDAVFLKKLQSYREQIDDIINGKGTIKNIERFKEKIRKMRGAAIAKSGEFSQENLIFKSLRNEGYLEKLSDYHRDVVDKSLSIESVKFKVVEKAKLLKNRADFLLEGVASKEYINEKHGDYFNSQLEDEPIEIGDRVEVIGSGSGSGLKRGTKGTIIGFYNAEKNILAIDFDNFEHGHNCANAEILERRPHTDTSGWYVSDIKVKLIHDKKGE